MAPPVGAPRSVPAAEVRPRQETGRRWRKCDAGSLPHVEIAEEDG